MPLNVIQHTNEPCVVISDIHGDFNFFLQRLKTSSLKDCILIVAGDCGFGFDKPSYYTQQLAPINTWLRENNVLCYMIRGNHDDPSYFNKKCPFNFSNIKCLKDYTVLSFEDKNILLVGGAISIDRMRRIINNERKIEFYMLHHGLSREDANAKYPHSYWKNEMPKYNAKYMQQLLDRNIQITHVITHTSPHFAFKSNTEGIEYWLKIDTKLEKDLEKERRALTKIYEFLKENNMPLRQWIYGHFHGHNDETVDDVAFTALTNADFIFDVKEIV